MTSISNFVRDLEDSLTVDGIARQIFYYATGHSRASGRREETLWTNLGERDKAKFRTAALTAWNVLEQHKDSK